MTPLGPVVVTGSSGLIGSALVRDLRADGIEVRCLVRRTPDGPQEIHWDPAAGTIDADALAGARGVVHLAGAGVGDQLWTPGYRQTILESRTRGTGLLARTLAGLAEPPEVLVSGSAVGFYGETGEAVVDESAARGPGFLADVVQAWEAAASPAADAGIRVAFARTGVVATSTGGALSRLLLPLRLGVGGPLGTGRQWWPLVSLADEVRALRMLLADERATGPYNLVAGSWRMSELVRALGRAYRRPTLLPVPGAVLRVALGELSSVVLDSQRVAPTRLDELGFVPRHRDLEAVVAEVRAGH